MGNLNCQFRLLGLHRAIMADGTSRGVPFQDEDLRTLTLRYEREGSSFILVTLPKFGKAVDQGLVSGSFKTPEGFALKSKTRLPKFLNSCLRQVFGDDGDLLGAPNVETIFYLRQFLLINSKLRTEFSVDQQDRVVKEFSERQNRLLRSRLPKDHFVLLSARNALWKALRHLDLTDIRPGHGPGVVHEGRDKDERWDFNYWSSQANKVYPFDEYGVQSLEHLRCKADRVVYLSEMTTRICLVPKDFKGPRLISVEMSGNQYLQQGQMHSMMAYIEKSSLLSRSIRLRDQAYSQFRAQSSYKDGLATLDLSNASDTVTAPLVWYLLSGMPKLRRQLFSTRSQFATWKGSKVRLAAFAPMGSATCFPVETLVFWSLAIGSLALYRYGRKAVKLSYRDLLDLGREIVVFGDDIIIPEDALPTLIATLQAVGCEPNMSKTCWLTPFRESCGSEWFNGLDVTITRNKEVPYDQRYKISHYPDLQDLQRRLYVAGLYKSAKLIRDWIVDSGFPVVVRKCPEELRFLSVSTARKRLVFEDESEPCTLDSRYSFSGYSVRFRLLAVFGRLGPVCLGDDDLLDRRTQIRWNSSLQRAEFRVPASYQKSRDWCLGNSHGQSEPAYAGYARLHARLLGDSSDRIPIRGSNTKIGWRPFPSGSFLVVDQEFLTRD